MLPMLPNNASLLHIPSASMQGAPRLQHHYQQQPILESYGHSLPQVHSHGNHDLYHCYENEHEAFHCSEGYGKPRNRFTEYEDAVICEGVAKGLTWGQISAQLPNRKRATCFNRYRTLQGIRKSRRRVNSFRMSTLPYMVTPPASRRASIVSCSTRGINTPSPSPPLPSATWFPSKNNASTPSRHWVPDLVMDRSSSSSWLDEYSHHGAHIGYRF